MQIINLGNRIVNNYMVKTENGYILIDTGYENQYGFFCKKLRRHNIQTEDIDYIFLTHAHDDHAGFLNELLRHTHAKVIMQTSAAAGLRRGQNSFDGGCSTRLALAFCKAMSLFGKGDHLFPSVERQYEERFIFLGDERIAGIEKELSVKIINTPGHTACSISLLFNNGILFCGDAAMNGFPSLHRATIWIENLDSFCRSWETMIALKPANIYPGHGRPFEYLDLQRFLPTVQKFNLYPLV